MLHLCCRLLYIISRNHIAQQELLCFYPCFWTISVIFHLKWGWTVGSSYIYKWSRLVEQSSCTWFLNTWSCSNWKNACCLLECFHRDNKKDCTHSVLITRTLKGKSLSIKTQDFFFFFFCKANKTCTLTHIWAWETDLEQGVARKQRAVLEKGILTDLIWKERDMKTITKFKPAHKWLVTADEMKIANDLNLRVETDDFTAKCSVERDSLSFTECVECRLLIDPQYVLRAQLIRLKIVIFNQLLPHHCW